MELFLCRCPFFFRQGQGLQLQLEIDDFQRVGLGNDRRRLLLFLDERIIPLFQPVVELVLLEGDFGLQFLVEGCRTCGVGSGKILDRRPFGSSFLGIVPLFKLILGNHSVVFQF